MTTTKSEGLLADEAPIWELDELRQLVADGQERGYLTIEQVTACLEEVDVTKEQVRELHAHFEELGIDLMQSDGTGIASPSPPTLPKRTLCIAPGRSRSSSSAWATAVWKSTSQSVGASSW